MEFKTEYELRKEAMERFRDLDKSPSYVSDMVKIWENNIRNVVKKLAQVSFAKGEIHNELIFARDALKKHGSHRGTCVTEHDECTCGLDKAITQVEDALREAE